jgi:uncharacterized OB-fold protein
VSAPRLVDATLFADGDGQALAGSRCSRCATVTFPRQGSCPRCATSDVEPYTLPTRGAVWAFTEQLFPPKPPYAVQGADFRPYVVGYVDLDGEVLVESRLVGVDPGALRIGQHVRQVTEAFTPAGDVVTYAFTPVDDGTDG